MFGWLVRLCRECRSMVLLEYGLVSILVIVVIISGLQLLISSGPDLMGPDSPINQPPSGF